MIQEQNFNARPDASGGYKVDVSRGSNVDRVSSEWFSRPDDERYLSLDDLFASVKGRAERSRTRTVESAARGKAPFIFAKAMHSFSPMQPGMSSRAIRH